MQIWESELRQEETAVNIKTEFTRFECERYRRDCNFTPEELAVFDLAVQNTSDIKIASILGMSTSTVSRRIKAIKRKIIKVKHIRLTNT